MTDGPNDDGKGYESLLQEVCVGLGFCGTWKRGHLVHVDLFIPPSGMVTAEQFAEWVVLADNLNPNENKDMLPHIRAAFVRHMGAETVDAEKLRPHRIEGRDP